MMSFKTLVRINLAVAIWLATSASPLLGEDERDSARLINDCGVNSLYLLLRLQSVEVDLAALRRALPNTKEHGLSMAEIQAVSSQYGVSLAGNRIGPRDVPIDRPKIALLKSGESSGHFVVLEPVGTLGKMVMVLDFPRPPRIVAYIDLMSADNWTGLALTPVTPWERHGLWFASGVGVSLVVLGVVAPWKRSKAFKASDPDPTIE